MKLSAGRKAFSARGSFFREDSGSTGVIFGLAFIPAFLMVGAALDYRNATVMKSRLQRAVDSASIAIAQADATTSLTAQQAIAQNIVYAQLGWTATAIGVTVAANDHTGGYVVSAAARVPTIIMKLAQVDAIPISASATAAQTQASVSGGGAGCVLSLNQSAVEALDWTGNANVTLQSCDIYGNSGASDALQVSGSAQLSARMVSVNGNIAVQGGGTLNAIQLTGQPRLPDPYESLPLPSFSGCDHNGFSTNDGGPLNPGVYCNGLSINTNSGSKGPVTLNPGLYVIDGGQLSINSQAQVTGVGVTIVFTQHLGTGWANATINGGAQVDLEAPLPGATAGVPGVVIYGDRSMATGTPFKLNGGSSQTFKGVVYLPEASVSFNGGAATSSGCMQLIADTVTFTGDSNIDISGCGAFGVTSFGYSLQRTVRLAF
ncbi:MULTISPECIES: TadE/TadG family type IV pilus assembly protein [Methylocystis]|uniref:TadE/TadG family type IV pilus assembly protein n=1 Tax=Methylocystis TaxID=133 RepID=UPI001921F8F0|nr:MULTISPECIES: TadE/TadG family type IV pilus assembly protein [Methylocystis]MBL1255386.1 pilus assembly protein [Methylocystis sp. Sn-Cys]